MTHDQDQIAALPDPQRTGASPRALAFVFLLLVTISLASFWYFYSRGMTNVYHDGLAHVNIARKVVDHPDDSIWQRYIQIGSPWLPVQTVAMLPLVANDRLWRTGAAGSIVSMVSYVLAGLAVFLIATNAYKASTPPYRNVLPVISLGVFALSPSVLYMQSTPMTELPFMATLSLAVLGFQRWVTEQTVRRLIIAGLLFSLAMLTRYEAWPTAAAAVALVLLVSRGPLQLRLRNMLVFVLVASSGAVYWMWHNWAIWGDPLTFLRGPYSARGLYLQYQSHFAWAKMFIGNAGLDVALILLTVAVCAGPLLLVAALAGLFSVAARWRNLSHTVPVFLFSVPLVFHLISVYRGEIQMMAISAIGLYNVRYGLPHLLLLSMLVPSAAFLLRRLGPVAALSLVSAVIAAQYVLLISDGPSQIPVYQEAYRNGVNSRVARQLLQAVQHVREHPPAKMILMHTGALGPLVSNGGMRFADIIHEGSMRWHQVNNEIPADVSTVILQDGDPLDERIRSSTGLSADFKTRFRETYSVGRIRVFERTGLSVAPN